jgi:hypothetical protein
MNTTKPALVLVAVLAAGCDPAVDGSSDRLITRTIVAVGSDGKPSVSEETITEAQQRAEIAARERKVKGQTGTLRTGQSAITVISSCPDESTWLFTGPNLTGKQLCLIGAGVQQLSEFLLTCGPISDKPPFFEGPCTTWAGHVGSYWVGATGAFRKDVPFITWPDDSPNWVPFAYWERVDSVAAPSFQTIRLDF